MQQSSTSSQRPGWLLPALIVPFLGLSALMVAAGSGQVAPPPTQASQQTVEVVALQSQRNYVQQHLAYGRVEAAKQASLGFELSGTLQTLTVDEGERVSAGQVLAKLDTARLDARMVELRAALARAQADARLAKLSERRVAELVVKKLESEQRLDEVRESTKASDAQVDEIQARIDSLEVELQKSVILAPYAGAILERPADPGTVVAAGQTVLQMQEDSSMEVRIALAEDDAMALSVGEQHALRRDTLTVPATIKSIGKRRAVATRTVDVIFSIQTNDAVLPGDLLTFSYEKAIEEAGFWVPKDALTSGVRGLWTLFTVSDAGQQTLSSRIVEVLYTEPKRAYVRGALDSKDLLVVSGTQRLVPEQTVMAKVIDRSQLALEH